MPRAGQATRRPRRAAAAIHRGTPAQYDQGILPFSKLKRSKTLMIRSPAFFSRCVYGCFPCCSVSGDAGHFSAASVLSGAVFQAAAERPLCKAQKACSSDCGASRLRRRAFSEVRAGFSRFRRRDGSE